MARKAAKPPRRKPNTGSIRFKKGRERPYEAAFPIGHGEHRYESFSSRSEAEAYLDKLTAERDRPDNARNITEGSQLVKVLFPRWLEIRRGKVAPRTYETYKYLLELASGEIGRYRVDEVSHEIADDMLMYFYRKGFQNVKQIKDVCHQVFKYAKKRHYINENPFEDMELPTVERREAIAISAEQRAHLLACGAIEDNPDVPLCVLWHLYSRLAFRRGEGMGLLWQDCNLRDLGKATITIRQQLTREGNHTALRGTTKTKEPRTVPAPRDIAEMLVELREWQVKRAAKNPNLPFPTYVFTDAKGASLKVQYVQDRWAKLRKRAEMPNDLHIHDLRHTSLYLWGLAGVPDNVLMALGGHKTIEMSKLYQNHATVEDMRRALG